MVSHYVRSKYQSNETVHFQSLTDAQCRQIYFGALEIMERTGAEVHDEEALQIYQDAGCWVEGKRVRIPSALVEWAIASAPSRVVLCNRMGEPRLFLEGRRTYYGPGPTNTYYLDPLTGEKRQPRKDDKVQVARVCDALENIDFVMDLGTPGDVTGNLADVHSFEAMLLNTTKPIVHWGFDVEQYQDMVDMAVVVAGSLERLQQRPFVAFYSEPSSPLQHSREALAKALFVAERQLPLVYTPCVMAGATTPASMAAVVELGLVESLVGLVATQLKKKGSPFIMGGVYTIMDMQTTIFSYGSPEFNILQAGIAEMSNYLDLPVFGTAGCTDSKTIDGQAAIESAFSILTAAQSGANLVHDVGYMEYGSTGSLEQLTLGDEIIGMLKRIMRGIEVTDETLAVDVVDRVGPGGHFLQDEHTSKHFRGETWFPSLINRMRYDEWKRGGGTTMGQRIKEKIQGILDRHQVEPLPEEKVLAIKAIVEKAETREQEKKKNK